MRFYYFTHHGADHDGTEFRIGGVRFGLVHASTHVGVEGQIMCADNEFAFTGLGDFGFDNAKMAFFDRACRAGGE